MCLSPLLCFVEFLPYFCLVTIPLFGAFCGTDIILRLSILLYIHSIIIDILQKISFPLIPLVQLLILGGLSVWCPVNLTPAPVIWFYDKLLWATEPVLLLAEAVLALNFVMRCSERLQEKLEDSDDGDGWKWRMLLSLFSALTYGAASYLLHAVYQDGTHIQTGMLLLVIVLVVSTHNMMWLSQEAGLVCDAAFCGLCTVCIYYAMVLETAYIRDPLAVPPTWKGTYKESFFGVLASILQVDIRLAGRAIQLLYRFVSPFFLVSLAIRLYSILFIVDKVSLCFSQDEEANDDEKLLDPMFPWRSTLLLKMAVIFMVTQLTTLWLSEVSGVLASQVDSLPLAGKVWPREILLGRLFQILAVNGFYMWRLYQADEWSWCEWLGA